jgi:Winged helix DNA-binding domain
VETYGWAQVMAWRLARHHLDERAPAAAMLDVAADICGLHAQVMSSAELTLWARVDGLEPDAVRRALWEERTLVKTWAMRGTLHLLPAAEYPLWQAARSTTRLWEAASWLRGFGVTREELAQLVDAVGEALDGRILTREELAAEVARLTGSPKLGEKLRESWGALLKPAAALGRLCFAPSRGQQVRFTRPDRWLGGWREHDPDEALLEVIRRFLAASGPVTREDVTRWWGVPSAAQVQKRIEGLGEEVTVVDVDGTSAYLLAADAPGLARAVPVGPAAARLRPVRRHRHPAGRPADARAVQGADLPGAGLVVAGAAGRRPHGRRLAAGDQGPPPAGDDRALRHAARVGAAHRRGRGRAAGGLERRPARARLGRGTVATPAPGRRTAAIAPTA